MASFSAAPSSTSNPFFSSSTPPKIIPHHHKTMATYTADFRPSSLSTTPSSSSHYDVLGIPTTATGNEIKVAYRKLARVAHPDVVTCITTSRKESPGTEEFMRINAAYATLSDPGKRADYDREFYTSSRWSMKAASLSSSEYGFSGRSCRNWETDQCW